MPSGRSAALPAPLAGRLADAPPAPAGADRAPAAGRGALVARSAVLVGVCLAALEIACRVEDRIRFGTPLLSRFTSQGDLMVRDAQGAHGRPGGRFQKWVMNDLGMRGPPAAARPPAGTLRVVVAGASETFGLYESPDREYPRQLEDSLRAVLAGAGACGGAGPRRVEVLNAALPGMSLPTVTQDLRLRVPALEPQVIVLYPTPPQYLEDRLPAAARPDSSPSAGQLPWHRALQPRALVRLRTQGKQMLPSAAQSWLRQRDVERARSAHPATWRFSTVPSDRLAEYEAALRGAVGAARAAGARPVIATHANRFAGTARPDPDLLLAWERFYPRASGELIVAFDAAANERTRVVARDSAVALVDLERTVSGGPELFADFSHFTDAGAARVAGQLAHAVAATAGEACAPRAPSIPAGARR